MNPREHADRILGALGYCLESAAYFADLGDWIRVNEYLETAQCHRRALIRLESRRPPLPPLPVTLLASTPTT